MRPPIACVADPVFDVLLAGKLPAESAGQVLEHAEICSVCGERLAALLQRDEIFGALRFARGETDRAEAEEVDRLVQRLVREGTAGTTLDHFPAALMQVRLTVTAGPYSGRVFTLEGHDTFLAGRSARCHLRLDDKYFSRVHFLIEVNPPSCRLVDLGSRNGTMLNGERVTVATVRTGDSIKAGHTRLRVELVDTGPADGERTTTTTPEAPPAIAAGGAWPDIAGYRVEEELGRGGMGVVHRARREADGADVALKTLIPALAGSPSLVAKFLREALILKKLAHPRIVRFLDMGEANGVLFFVMEYVPGTDVSRILKERGPLAVKSAVRIAVQLLSALAYAHARGFVHRDIKPSNLLLEERGGSKRGVKVADFGLARAYDASGLSGLTLTSDLGGTVDFMPPEQVANFREVTPAADQFSAAATLYRLLTNASLYDDSKPGHPLMKVMEGEIVPLSQRRPDLPAGLVAAVTRGLAREPAERFADATGFREALLPFGRGGGVR